MNSMVLINGQWQGGADIETYDGAEEIENLYLSGMKCLHAPVSLETNLNIEDQIIGGKIIRKQICDTLELLQAENPSKLFTIGGGCDADVASLYYIYKKYDGDLTVVWFDAHGDINAPEESDSHLFFGMPLRMLLGDKHFADIIETPLRDEQVLNVGGRDLDDSEFQYMRSHHIPVVAADKLEEVLPVIRSKKSRHVYIHLDLDCLEPSDFSSTPLPVPDGIRFSGLMELLCDIKSAFDVVGLGLYEYKPCGEKLEVTEQLIKYGLEFTGTWHRYSFHQML